MDPLGSQNFGIVCYEYIVVSQSYEKITVGRDVVLMEWLKLLVLGRPRLQRQQIDQLDVVRGIACALSAPREERSHCVGSAPFLVTPSTFARSGGRISLERARRRVPLVQQFATPETAIPPGRGFAGFSNRSRGIQ